MKYSIITFDDNTFFNARLTNNDMVCIERYIRKNPLTMFSGIPPLGDLAFIIYMSLRESSDYTLDDVYDYIDENALTIDELIAIVIQLFKDMGFIEDIDMEEQQEVVEDIPNTTSSNKKEENKSFKKIANEILSQYLIVGSAEEFWDSNLDEVTKAFDMYKKQLRTKSESDYMLAMMTSTSVGLMLGGKSKKMPKVEEFFPQLYSKEELDEREKQRNANELLANFASYAERLQERKKQRQDKDE